MNPALIIFLILILLGVGVGIYFITKSGKCKNIVDANAVSWNDDCSIKTCKSGYNLNADGICVSCTNVADANANSWNTDCSIKGCNVGYSLIGGACTLSNTAPTTTTFTVYQGAGNLAPTGFLYYWDKTINLQAPPKPTTSISQLSSLYGSSYKYVAITRTGKTDGNYYAAVGNTLPSDLDSFTIKSTDPAYSNAIYTDPTSGLVSGYKNDGVPGKTASNTFNKRGGCTWAIYTL